jgi:hypothetical protein
VIVDLPATLTSGLAAVVVLVVLVATAGVSATAGVVARVPRPAITLVPAGVVRHITGILFIIRVVVRVARTGSRDCNRAADLHLVSTAGVVVKAESRARAALPLGLSCSSAARPCSARRVRRRAGPCHHHSASCRSSKLGRRWSSLVKLGGFCCYSCSSLGTKSREVAPSFWAGSAAYSFLFCSGRTTVLTGPCMTTK